MEESGHGRKLGEERWGGTEGGEGHEKWWDGGLIVTRGQIGPVIGESWQVKQR